MISRPSADPRSFNFRNVKSDQLLFLNENRGELRKSLEEMPRNMKNPFTVMRRWLNYEILDLEAILEAIDHKNEMEKRKMILIVKKNEDLTLLDNIKQGKTMVKTMFMSNNSKRDKIAYLQKTTSEAALSIECLGLLHKITVL
jgi:hypothetical protein